jgi:hypothetical protein
MRPYVLRIDGTYSYKDETLYIFRSYEQGLVLYAATAKKDDTAHVQPLLERVLAMYGTPMAVISDMQPALNVIGKNAPLNKRGFDTDLATMRSSVSYET